MEYKIYKNFVPNDLCDEIVSRYKNEGYEDIRGEWDTYPYTLNKGPLYTKILEFFSPLVPWKFNERWMNINEYNIGEGLAHHRDAKASNYTIISALNDGYTGGRFVIKKKTYIEMAKGDTIVLNGGKILHGVEKVSNGSRIALNIWTIPQGNNSLL